MIGIKVNGEYLQLRPDTIVSIRLNSPVFADDNIIKGSFTLPFTIPIGAASEENDRILNAPGWIEKVGSTKKFEAELYYDGVLLYRGTLTIKEGTPTEAQAHFIFGVATLGEAFKTTGIREAVRETIVLADNAVEKKVFVKPVGSAPYRIRVNGNVFEGNTLIELRDAINASEQEPKASAATPPDTTPGGLTPDYLEIKPFAGAMDPLTPFTVQAADDTAEERARWTIDTFAFTDYLNPILAAIDNYFDHLEPYPTDKFRFPYVANPGLYEDDFTGGSTSTSNRNKTYPSINAKNATGPVTNNPNTGNFLNLNRNSLAPYVRLRYVLDKIAELFEFSTEGNVLENADVNRLLFYTSNTLDDQQPFIGTRPFIWWKRSFDVADFVPDIKCVDLLKELQKLLNVAVYMNDRTGRLRLQFRKTIITDRNYTDITGQVSPLRKFSDESLTGLRLRQEIETTDAIANGTPTGHEFDVDTWEEEIVTGFSPVFFNITYNIDESGNTANGPYIIQRLRVGKNMRLIFYRDYAAGSGYQYPSASRAGVTFNLQWDGTQGLYNQWWKEWARFIIERRMVMYEWYLDLPELTAIDWERKYRIDRTNHLLKSVQVNLTMTGIRPAQCEFYTCR